VCRPGRPTPQVSSVWSIERRTRKRQTRIERVNGWSTREREWKRWVIRDIHALAASAVAPTSPGFLFQDKLLTNERTK
jgi:hypothetical protein